MRHEKIKSKNCFKYNDVNNFNDSSKWQLGPCGNLSASRHETVPMAVYYNAFVRSWGQPLMFLPTASIFSICSAVTRNITS